MDSIVKANEQGKIKIKKVTDAIAKNVEIIIELSCLEFHPILRLMPYMHLQIAN